MDLERSKRFYREILVVRPDFPFPGAWFAIGGHQQLHLIAHGNPTFRKSNKIDTQDVHVAVRVGAFRETVEFLHGQGYRADAVDGDPMKLIVRPRPTAGFPQIYILDPDRHVIEINSEELD